MRFVILHHTDWAGHGDHYDLMLQMAEGRGDADAVLRTFATEANSFPGEGIRMRLIHDHRRAYLTYEGPLSENRGRVERVDEGEYEMIEPENSAKNICLRAAGNKFRGSLRLRHDGQGVYYLETIS